MYPMKMKPIFKDYLWGGQKLKTIFKKPSDLAVTAESWELSCCEDGLTYVENGEYQGMSLMKVLDNNPEFKSKKNIPDFPLLIKLIDSAQNLSIQVHPSDQTAISENGEQGKAEIWYIISADKGSYIYYGFSESVSKKELKERIEQGSVCEVLNKVYVNEGDVFYILPGTVHAIGKGCVIAEVQQSSNTTFRIFDYNRVDPNGNKRELHIKRAIEIIDFNPIVPEKTENNNTLFTDDFSLSNIFDCNYFKVSKIEIKKKVNLNCNDKSFQSILFVKGKGRVNHNNIFYDFEAGDSYFIPAGMGIYEIEGVCTLLLSSL